MILALTVMVTNYRLTDRRLLLTAEQCIENQQNPANHNGGIGNIKVRPVIMNDVHFEKVNDVTETQRSNALPKSPPRISARATVVAVNLRPIFSKATSTATAASKENQAAPIAPGRRTRIIEQTKRRTRIFHVADGEHMRNHLMLLSTSIRVAASHFVTRSAATTSTESNSSQPLESFTFMRLSAGGTPI